MDVLITIVLTILLLIVGLTIGSWQERRHFRSIREREEALRAILLIPSRYPPNYDQRPYRTELVCGSVVIAMDYFKTFAGSLRQIFGGQISFYETLVERARREAILRMKEEARDKQAQMIFNVKFSTANIMKDKAGNPGGSVEAIAFGTAIIYR
ncbi:MAG: YbjQ family protein [Candidatus Adiutrix sp.]|jgi:uncharacterized protein YbjQ (UPF0145 family)|nr:YbjQ family protein [Candidatus Adiutrix sp.]